MIVLKWNFGKITYPLGVDIEIFDNTTNDFVPLAYVPSDKVEYTHIDGDTDTIYRFIVYYAIEKEEQLDFTTSDDYQLTYTPVVEASVKVYSNDTLSLETLDYSVDYNTGILSRNPSGPIPQDASSKVIYLQKLSSEPTLPKQAMNFNMCRVHGYIYNTKGFPVANEIIFFRTHRPPRKIDKAVLEDIPVECKTGVDGYFEIPLLVGSVVRVFNTRLNIDKVVVIPDANSITFEELLNID